MDHSSRIDKSTLVLVVFRAFGSHGWCPVDWIRFVKKRYLGGGLYKTGRHVGVGHAGHVCEVGAYVVEMKKTVADVAILA